MRRAKKVVLLLSAVLTGSLFLVMPSQAQGNVVLHRYFLQPFTEDVYPTDTMFKMWGEASKKAGVALLTGGELSDGEMPPEEAKEDVAGIAAGRTIKTVTAQAVQQPIQEQQTEAPKPNQSETFPSGQYPVMGQSAVTVEQMVKYYQANNGKYPGTILGKGGAGDIQTFCQIYYEEAAAEGVRAEVAFAQTMKETGWLQYGGDADISQYNFSGLGTTGGGVAGNAFPDVRTGVRAQIQHLKAYATAEALKQTCVDARYAYVKKGCAPYVEWLGQQENPNGYGWATGNNYGYDIVNMIGALKGMS